MQWTVRLEARTSQSEVKTTELVTFSRPAMVSTLAEIGLMLAESKTLLAKLQVSMLCGQVVESTALRRVCVECGMLQPLKDRRTRRLQTLFGTVEVEAPRFKVCRCRQPVPMVEARTVSPVCALLTARCTPELERVRAELGAHLVSGCGGYPGPLAAGFAGKPGERAQPHPHGRPADRGGRPASSSGGHGCPGRAGQGRCSGREPARRHARWRLHTCCARSPGSQLRGGLRQGRA